MSLSNDSKEALHESVLRLSDFDLALRRRLDSFDLYDPKQYDLVIQDILDLLGVIIQAKVDAEIHSKFK